MKKLLAGALAGGLLLGGAGFATAQPGPNGRNDYGLCKAYFAGSDQGRANKRQAPPFQALEKAAGVDGDDTPAQTDQKVADYCAQVLPGGGGGGAGAPGRNK